MRGRPSGSDGAGAGGRPRAAGWLAAPGLGDAGPVSDAPPLPKIVSVDDHVIEPAHLFDTWLPQRYRDRGPRPVRTGIGGLRYADGRYHFTADPDGHPADWWQYEDLLVPYRRNIAAVGFDRDDMTLEGITYDEMRPGCYDPTARLADMDLNWVEASLSFPTFPRFCGQTFLEAKDKDLALACVRAYNDWMVEEWCGDSGGRLIPLIIIPLWDPELAAAEVRRNAERGVHAVCFSEMPPLLGLPSIHVDHWDPFFAACDETATTVNLHIGSSSTAPAASPDAPPAAQATLAFNNAMASMTDWLFSGKLNRFRGLRIAYSEGQIGWIPYILERADDVWEQHRAWGGAAETTPEPPSTYYRRQMFGCFFRDRHGISSLAEIGEDTVTFETDYPHVDSTWPHSRQVAEDMTSGLSDEATYKVLRGNAIRMLSLDLDRDRAPAS
jgi:predicted TIM-barrel fold metal-dependent hydrolase